jgi:hypothetical protein
MDLGNLAGLRRPISAHAEEPSKTPSGRLSLKAYLRARGGTVDSWDERRPPFGELGTLPPEWSSVIVWENRKESMWQSVATATT